VWFTKKKPVAAPIAPIPLPDPKPIPPEPTLPPPPPKIDETPNPSAPTIPPEKIVTAPAPQRPRPTRRRPIVAAPKQITEAPQQEQPASPSAPKLAQLFSSEQRNEYNKTLDDALNRVRAVLSLAASRQLSDGQHEVVNRIRAFEKQALQARDQDLLAALSLANRADVLAKELQAQFQ